MATGSSPAGSAWTARPGARSRRRHAVGCAGSCTAAIAGAVAAGGRLLAHEGDIALDGPLDARHRRNGRSSCSSSGTLRLRGAVTLHGVVVAGALDWRDAAANAGALIRGAALIEGSYQGDAAADFVHDATLLARLQRQTGSFARVNGSWKDF